MNTGDQGFSSVLDSHKDTFSKALYTHIEKRSEPLFWVLGSPGGQRGVKGFFYKNGQDNYWTSDVISDCIHDEKKQF